MMIDFSGLSIVIHYDSKIQSRSNFKEDCGIVYAPPNLVVECLGLVD
ncbi:hypothetical protein [Francisella tularensis]|nr:hypothetical protein [Francisella tularensis]MBD2809128.1 hypothetical protein [Francisella tularensis]